MLRKKISFASGKHTLVGSLIIPSQKTDIGVLILHGAGKSTKERYVELLELLASNGYTSLAFDFRGVGESSGKFVEGTLLN